MTKIGEGYNEIGYIWATWVVTGYTSRDIIINDANSHTKEGARLPSSEGMNTYDPNIYIDRLDEANIGEINHDNFVDHIWYNHEELILGAS